MTGYAWGGTRLYVEDYRRPGPAINLTEQPLLPARDDPSPQSVLSGRGRLRRRVEIRGWCTEAEFNSFEADRLDMIPRLLECRDGLMMTALFEILDGRRERNADGILFYEALWVEVEDGYPS